MTDLSPSDVTMTNLKADLLHEYPAHQISILNVDCFDLFVFTLEMDQFYYFQALLFN